MSRTLQHADAINRPILEAALVDHEKHYRALCSWVARGLKNRRKKDWTTGPGALSDLLSEGHTAATVIWETYGPK